MKRLVLALVVLLVSAPLCFGEQKPSALAGLQEWRTDDSAVTTGTGMRLFGGLFLCLGVLGGVVFVAKRYGVGGVSTSSTSRLKVLERASISNRSSVALIAIDGRDFLVASAGDSVAIQPIQQQGANSDLLIKDLEELCESSAL